MLQECLVHVVWGDFAEVFQFTVHTQQQVRKCTYIVTVMCAIVPFCLTVLKERRIIFEQSMVVAER
jgi:hypothetical protein